MNKNYIVTKIKTKTTTGKNISLFVGNDYYTGQNNDVKDRIYFSGYNKRWKFAILYTNIDRDEDVLVGYQNVYGYYNTESEMSKAFAEARKITGFDGKPFADVKIIVNEKIMKTIAPDGT